MGAGFTGYGDKRLVE